MSKRLWCVFLLLENEKGGNSAAQCHMVAAGPQEAVGFAVLHFIAEFPGCRIVNTLPDTVSDALILEAADLIRAEREGGA